uniref:Uncharacterized protein n=1 Tax=Anguilla anguilla TaxID=7936 RepID=A0A0E9U1Z2_ANGAN
MFQSFPTAVYEIYWLIQ